LDSEGGWQGKIARICGNFGVLPANK
jgi:hypothetical protein